MKNQERRGEDIIRKTIKRKGQPVRSTAINAFIKPDFDAPPPTQAELDSLKEVLHGKRAKGFDKGRRGN